MLIWEGEDKIVYPPFAEIKGIDVLRAKNYLLPLQYQYEMEASRAKDRTVVLPEGYLFDANWKNDCPCELLLNSK